MSWEINNDHPLVRAGADTVAQKSPLLDLPKDVWGIIFSFLVTPFTQWKHIVNYTLVSHQFRDFCILSVERYQMYQAIKKLTPPKVMSIYPLQEVEKHQCHYEFLAIQRIEKTERRYMGLFKSLYILNSSSEGFVWISLSVGEILWDKFKSVIKAHGLVKQMYGWDIIVSCHPTEEGFILVTDGGVSVWNYNKKSTVPECTAFYSPFHYDAEPPLLLRCQYSTFHNNILYVTSGAPTSFSIIRDFYKLDLSQSAPQFEKIPLFKDAKLRICQTPKGNFFALKLEESAQLDTFTFQQIEIKSVQSPLPALDTAYLSESTSQIVYYPIGQSLTLHKSSFRGLKYKCMVKNWFVFETHIGIDGSFLIIFDTDTFSFWGEELKLKPPLNCFGHLFFSEDFLFLSYNTDNDPIRVIHLPTKKEYTEKLMSFLKPYLHKKTLLTGVHYCRSHFQILLQTETTAGKYVLHSVKILIELSEKELSALPQQR